MRDIAKLAIAEYEPDKKECCGLLLSDGTIQSCINQSKNPTQEFIIATKIYSVLDRKKKVKAIFHSHTNGNNNFSAADVELVNRTQKPLILYDVEHNQFKAIDPSGSTPLLGREFVYGVYDCFSLVRDYYKQIRAIELPNYARASERAVWDEGEWNWIDREYKSVGFTEVESPEVGDVLAMSLGSNTTGINHLGVYLGDNIFLHQLCNRKSNQEVWGSPWIEYTIKFLRYIKND